MPQTHYPLSPDEKRVFDMMMDGIQWDDVCEADQNAILELADKYPDITKTAVSSQQAESSAASDVALSQMSYLPESPSGLPPRRVQDAYHKTKGIWKAQQYQQPATPGPSTTTKRPQEPPTPPAATKAVTSHHLSGSSARIPASQAPAPQQRMPATPTNNALDRNHVLRIQLMEQFDEEVANFKAHLHGAVEAEANLVSLSYRLKGLDGEAAGQVPMTPSARRRERRKRAADKAQGDKGDGQQQ